MKNKKKLVITIASVIAVIAIITAIIIFNAFENKKDNKKEAKVVETSTKSYKSDLGVSNWKIDDDKLELSEEEKILVEYFDDDYFVLNNYESLQRYPDAYKGTQVVFVGSINKILKYEGNNYEALANILTFDGEKIGSDDQNVVIKGTTEGARITENDMIKCYGRYSDVETYTIDGKSYTIPTIKAHRVLVDNHLMSFKKFDENDIKKVARALFGNDVKVRKAVYGEDFEYDELHDSNAFFMIATLDNQSNANFNKYEVYQQYGLIRDSNSTVKIERNISFSADFKHYLISIYDSELKELTIEYYDKDLKKIWSKEFEHVINPVYDYTTDKVYTMANNELYILDINTGKEIQKSFIGSKFYIRKMQDGIFTCAPSLADAIMKTDDKGNIVWKLDLDKEIAYVDGVQIKDDGTMVVSVNYVNDSETGVDLTETLIVIDKDGNKILETSGM